MGSIIGLYKSDKYIFVCVGKLIRGMETQLAVQYVLIAKICVPVRSRSSERDLSQKNIQISEVPDVRASHIYTQYYRDPVRK